MKKLLFTSVFAGLVLSPTAYAQDHNSHDHHQPQNVEFNISNAHDSHDSHQHNVSFAPISVMGDHMHGKGKWMLSYRFMRMKMEDNRDGTNGLTPQEISGVYPNATTTGTSTLRIVPTKMTMDMHMVSAMYGLTEDITLMAMGHYIDKDMDHLTFSAMDATNQIGEFTTKSEGFGDAKIAALYDAYQSGSHKIVLKAGLSLPIGSLDEEGDILNPMGAVQRVRLPYAMQIGTGTYDFEPALTYSGSQGDLGWGVQYQGQIRLGDNDEDYSLGDKHILGTWAGYKWNDWLLTTARLSGEIEGKIDGQDDNISGPVQTADPDNYGGKRVEAGLGFMLLGGVSGLQGHNFGGELVVPFYQNLNGPQLERDYTFTLGYQYRF